MKVRKVQLHNVRLIKDMNLSFDDKRVTIILGENGKGKTTLLDAIALCANVFTSAFPNIKKRNPSPWDIHIDEHNEVSDYLSIQTTFSFNEDTDIEVERFLRRDALVKATSSVGEKELRDYALSQLEQIQHAKEVRLPVLCITVRNGDEFRLRNGIEISRRYLSAGTAISMLQKQTQTSNAFSSGLTIRKTWNGGKRWKRKTMVTSRLH